MVTIDGTNISGVTIDGTAVQEITIDGTVAWTSLNEWEYTGTSYDLSGNVSGVALGMRLYSGTWYILDSDGFVHEYDTSFNHITTHSVTKSSGDVEGFGTDGNYWYIATESSTIYRYSMDFSTLFEETGEKSYTDLMYENASWHGLSNQGDDVAHVIDDVPGSLYGLSSSTRLDSQYADARGGYGASMAYNPNRGTWCYLGQYDYLIFEYDSSFNATGNQYDITNTVTFVYSIQYEGGNWWASGGTTIYKFGG